MPPFSLNRALCLATLVVPVIASAGVIIQPTAVTSTIGTYGSHDLVNVINQGTLSTKYVSGITDFDTYIAQTPTEQNSSGAMYAGTLGVFSASLTFTLGNTMGIESLALWNRGPNGQGVRDFRLYASQSANFASASLLGSFTAAAGNSFSGASAQVFSFNNTQAAYVRMDILNTHGSCCISLSEVAFEATPAAKVPEPGSIALLSLAGAGLVASRRKLRKSAARASV